MATVSPPTPVAGGVSQKRTAPIEPAGLAHRRPRPLRPASRTVASAGKRRLFGRKTRYAQDSFSSSREIFVRPTREQDIMPKLGMYEFNPIRLIDEVKSRPGLYRADQPLDREEKLMLWKEVGASLYNDWASFSKATAYDRVLQLQRKWRSLRDAYNRELRARRSGVRVNRRVYMYFKRMSFLGGYDGPISDDEDEVDGINLSETQSINDDVDDDPLVEDTAPVKPKKRKRIKKQEKKEVPSLPNEEVEMQVFPITEISSDETDSDRLFLLSFLPEMRQLPINVKMWARAQIASIMQEAVASHFSTTHGHEKGLGPSSGDVKMQRRESSEGQ